MMTKNQLIHEDTPNEVANAVKMASIVWIINFQVSRFMVFNV